MLSFIGKHCNFLLHYINLTVVVTVTLQIIMTTANINIVLHVKASITKTTQSEESDEQRPLVSRYRAAKELDRFQHKIKVTSEARHLFQQQLLPAVHQHMSKEMKHES